MDTSCELGFRYTSREADFVRCTSAFRPVTNLASLDAMLVRRSPRHSLILITEHACVSSYTAKLGYRERCRNVIASGCQEN